MSSDSDKESIKNNSKKKKLRRNKKNDILNYKQKKPVTILGSRSTLTSVPVLGELDNKVK